MNPPPLQLPASRRTSYQFPVYRWIGWLSVAGFAIGLTVMFFISGMFGIPAPLGWAAMVIIFTVLTLLLNQPKLLLIAMLFYFMLVPSNRLFGLLPFPLPAFVDELFFLPFIAVIVMNWIQRKKVKDATMFPLLFGLIVLLSWYVNGKPSVVNMARVILVAFKSYIIWYFCRLTCTFESEKQLLRWVWAYILYAAVQFLYNVLWQQALWPRYHPDRSGGVLGPLSNGEAHFVGYMSGFALMLAAGWWVSRRGQIDKRLGRWVLFMVLVIGYNLIFMTDTKHALPMILVAFLLFLFHPKLSARMRLGMSMAGVMFMVAAMAYLSQTLNVKHMRSLFNQMADSPKGAVFLAVTTDFHHLVPYPLLGAGPGRFTSQAAKDSRAPLARRYIIPYYDEARRRTYFGKSGSTVVSSALGSVTSDFFAMAGEMGWLGAAVYYSFFATIIMRLYRKSVVLPVKDLRSGVSLGLASSLFFMVMVSFLVPVTTVQVLAFPLWALCGCMWDMQAPELPGRSPEA